MNLLAVSYVLPPNQYPQAIQVGRLLYGLPARIVTVSGKVKAQSAGLDCYPDFDARLVMRLEVPFDPPLAGRAHQLAYRLLPLYAKAPDEFRGWVMRAAAVVEEYLGHSGFVPDVVASFGQPMSDHLLGLHLKQRLRLPWLAHFSDPWTDNPFRRQGPLCRPVNARMERRVVEHADRVIFTSAETLELGMRKYPAGWYAKACVLPHAYEPRLYATGKIPQGPLRIRHLGTFYGGRTPLPLFRGLQLLYRRDPGQLRDVCIELVGDVPTRFLHSTAGRGLPDAMVRALPTVDYSKSLEMMCEADLLLVIDAPAEHSVFLPSKLADYIGAGRPILGIVPPGASAQLIGRLGGEVVDPSDPEGSAAALSRSIEYCRGRRTEPGQGPWGKPDVRRQYEADGVAGCLARVLSEIAR